MNTIILLTEALRNIQLTTRALIETVKITKKAAWSLDFLSWKMSNQSYSPILEWNNKENFLKYTKI